jgi:hypothetical protein
MPTNHFLRTPAERLTRQPDWQSSQSLRSSQVSSQLSSVPKQNRRLPKGIRQRQFVLADSALSVPERGAGILVRGPKGLLKKGGFEMSCNVASTTIRCHCVAEIRIMTRA